MNLPLLLLIVIFTLLNISSFFVMAGKTPPYTIFTGAVHYPADYLYYLSFITQGKDHWFRAYHLFTGETNTVWYLNWIYVFFGHIGSFFHLSAPIIYQLMVIVGSVCYLVIAYKLIGLCVRKNPTLQLIVYILFLLSNALPNIHMENGSWIVGFFYPFNNLGHPFLRLTNVPHHLFISSFIMALFYAAGIFWQQKRMKLQMLFIAILGFLLSSMQPLQWAFITGILGITGMFIWWNKRSVSAFFPALICGFTGIVPALYLRHLYTLPPNSNMIAWEALQQTRIPFIHFLRLNGPVMILAIVGFPWIIKKLNTLSGTLILSAAVAIGIFFSPIPERLSLLNLRFISIIPTLAASFVTGELIWNIAKKIDPRRTALCAWFLVILTLAATIPVTTKQLIERANNALPQDMNAYLPFGARNIYDAARRVVDPTQTVLTDYIFSASFAGFTGKHVFAATQLGTIDFDQKLAQSNTFFYHPPSKEERMAWLAKNNIAYIVSYGWVPVDLPNLEIVSQDPYAILYRVL